MKRPLQGVQMSADVVLYSTSQIYGAYNTTKKGPHVADLANAMSKLKRKIQPAVTWMTQELREMAYAHRHL